MYDLTPDPGLMKDLAEERQRDILEEVEADHLAEEAAHGDDDADNNEVVPGNYQPVTDDDSDLVDSRESNRNVHKGER
ncbi:MAG: hypothetical protein HZC41_19355 [Chloroflexi bacterium]|nr:hypothetical protein [Chloroflexota bacterium]